MSIYERCFRPIFLLIVRLYKGKTLSDAEQRMPIKHIVFYFSASVIFARSMEVADYGASASYPIKKTTNIQGTE